MTIFYRQKTGGDLEIKKCQAKQFSNNIRWLHNRVHISIDYQVVFIFVLRNLNFNLENQTTEDKSLLFIRCLDSLLVRLSVREVSGGSQFHGRKSITSELKVVTVES